MDSNNSTQSQDQNKINLLNILVIILSLYVLLAFIVDTLFNVSEEVSRVLDLLDNAICIFFLIDFIVRFSKAESKLQFMKWGWIDLISSIPNVDFLRAGRALRLIRLIRILRAFKTTQGLVNHVFQSRAQGAFTSVTTIAVLLILFSSISILQFEDDPNSNIKTAEDAIWWSYVTITTVGYGDKFPVTTEGRVIGAILMTAGVGLFGTFTGFVSTWFLGGGNTRKEDEDTSATKTT
jgi:voltage-gated potassium channel